MLPTLKAVLHEYNMQYTFHVIYDDCSQICPYVLLDLRKYVEQSTKLPP